MDTSIIATLIGLVGGGAIGALGFILTGIRAEQRTNGELLKAHGECLAKIDERTKADSKRLVNVEERLGGLEKGFGGLEEGFGGLEERLGGLEGRLGGLEAGFGRLEERSISEFGQIKDVLARMEATQVRMEATQAEHGRQIEKLGGDLP